ncbi:MAG: ABC transporter substrate-binding protein [Armatimonadota bacterium]|nr:ABC transporter substrate-binding protein [Armatimonadota bacterium]
MSRVRARVTIAVTALLIAGLVLPAGVWGGPRSELVVVSGMWSPPNNFSPFNTDSAYGYYAVRFMFLPLVESRLEENQLKFYPALASKWEVGADFQTFTFTIHPRAAWHDGRPVTADDVLFTVMTISDPRAETNRGNAVALLAGLDARGKRTPGAPIGFRILGPKQFEVKTRTPVDPQAFLYEFGSNMYIIPRHVLGDVPPDQLSRHPFMQNPTVGNGPYKFVQYKTDQYVELLVNEHYHLGAPKLRRLFVRIIPPTVMMAQIERGDMDLTAGAGIGSILIDDWDRVKTIPHVRALSFPLPGYQFVVFNFQRPYLEKRVRRAVAHAINRPLIINQLLRGEAALAEGPIPPTMPYYNKDVKPWAYDPARARSLLQEAGWDAGRTLLLRVPTGNIIRERSADIIRENLVAVGIRVEIQKTDFPTHLAAIRAGNYDLALVGWSGSPDPDVSSQFRTGAVYNWLGAMSIPLMDQLLDEGKATPDPAKRRQIYNRFQEVFADELPYVVLYYENARNVIARRMSNVLHDVSGFYQFQTYSWVAAPQ